MLPTKGAPVVPTVPAFRTQGTLNVAAPVKQPFLPVIPAPVAVSPKALPRVIPQPVTVPKVTPVASPRVIPQPVTVPKVTPVASPRVIPQPVTVPKVTPVASPRVIPQPVPVPKVTPLPPVTVPKAPTIIPLPKMAPMPLLEPEEIELRQRQIAWANRAYNILLNNSGYIDTSKMGSGKTILALWIAKQFNFSILVIGPPTLEAMWRQAAARYGITMINFLSYDSLRSVKGKQPKNGYLIRRDTTVGKKNYVTFEASPTYLNLVNEGVFVICDEIDKIKNNSARYKATAALIHPIVSEGGRSRFALLSAIPFDKEEHAIQILRLLGYIRSPRLYSVDRKTKRLTFEGMQELIDVSRILDPVETERIVNRIPHVKSKMNKLAYELYINVVMDNIAGSMPPPDLDVNFDAKNGFYKINPQRLIQLRDGIDQLTEAVTYNEGNETAELPHNNLGRVTRALVQIEMSKTDDIARVATAVLTNRPNTKVIISMNYTDSLQAVRDGLIAFNPLILNGDVPIPKRQGIVDAFNNDPGRRVLIMNTAVGGHGINLQDTVGNAPRYMIISPSYVLLNIAQATGRIHREGSKSDSTVRMFYGKGFGARETSILTALARKSATAEGTVAGPAKDALTLPGDYPSEIEQ